MMRNTTRQISTRNWPDLRTDIMNAKICINNNVMQCLFNLMCHPLEMYLKKAEFQFVLLGLQIGNDFSCRLLFIVICQDGTSKTP